MKPDGVTMETTEPTEDAAVPEPSTSQDNVMEQSQEASSDAAPAAAPEAEAEPKPVATDPKVKPKTTAGKKQPAAKTAAASGSTSRPGTASQRATNDVKPANSVAAARKNATTITAKSSKTGAVPKRPAGGAAVPSTVKIQSRVPDRKPVGPARTTSVAAAASATNDTKPTAANGPLKKRPVAETVRPKTTSAASRPAASTASKPITSTTTKAAAGAVLKTARPTTGPSTSRPASNTSRPTTAMAKPSTTATAKTAASRPTTAPSTGRTTAAQPPKTVAAKKDVSRPASAALAKKPTTAPTAAVSKKPEPPRPAATVVPWSAAAKAVGPKVSQTKTQLPAKSTPTRKPAAAGRLPARTKPPLGLTPTSSPANSQAKRATKPTQAVNPLTAVKKTKVSNSSTPSVEEQTAANATVVATSAAVAAGMLAESQTEAPVSLPQGSPLAVSAPEEFPPPLLSLATSPEVVPEETTQSVAAASCPPQSPVHTALPKTPPAQEQLQSSAPLLTTEEQIPGPAGSTVPLLASLPDLSEDPVYLLTDQTPSTSKALLAEANVLSHIVAPNNLNEEEDEEEREGSQLVSESEMSGTTQPTEESRPGSAGPVGSSAWRASGALLSELDSEDVSGSQQGASELSAPGVLEGTESTDDLGDGSLKGASAGSPDFEKVPEIPVNDFDEDEEDEDNDRVCDMDVGSERADDPQKARHDNDVEEEEDDDDVDMASEGVTESGLESYGNADEDDFPEDERLDNLNRLAQQAPPPPPVLPSAPAAQWDQPNPFGDPWGEPLQPQQVLQQVCQPVQAAGAAAAASPLADPWQADPETLSQTRAQAWLEQDSSPFEPENQQVAHSSSVKDDPQNIEDQMCTDQSSSAPRMQTLAPALLSAPGMSLSSTLSSETSTPEELGDFNQDVAPRPQHQAPQPDLDYQDLGIDLEKEDMEGEEDDAEAETLPADEVLGGGPATAPTSNPSSSSVTEDEASDTEGEAQLDDSSEIPAVINITFDPQPPSQRSLSTVEEGEEADVESGVCEEDTTPPSATSLASYGFDTMTTASNSNAQSTGESCVKSPGIFSLEDLPEEAKDQLCPIPQPHCQQPLLAEHQYIECGKQDGEPAVGEEVQGPEEALIPSSTPSTLHQPEENPDNMQPPYYSAICEKTENSYAGFAALPQPHRREHARTYCDIFSPHSPATAPAATPKLTCADLPPRMSPGQKALSPQLRRLEQHHRQLLEMQQRREQQQSRPLEEAEQERKRREEEEARKKKEEAEEEIKRNKEEVERQQKKKEEEEELQHRKDLEVQLEQQEQELKQRQQIQQWQQELQQSSKGQAVLLSPSSGLCTIYEGLENSEGEDGGEDEEGEEVLKELDFTQEEKMLGQKTPNQEMDRESTPVSETHLCESTSPSTENPPNLPESLGTPRDSSSSPSSSPSSSLSPSQSPERPPPLELDWGKKVDIVQQLINQTLLLNSKDHKGGCSSVLLLPGSAGGCAGGRLSPLESSLWPSLLPPLTPPSATVTSVSSFSPEATGSSSPQGEWTVVELETHH